MIRYKVVSKELGSAFVSKEAKHYYRKYKIGKVVSAAKNTLGIFCWKNRKASLKYLREDQRLLKVEVIGRGEVPKKACTSYENGPSLTRFYKSKMNHHSVGIVDNDIICYSSIKVISELINVKGVK